jgi:uncharacterized protein
VVTGATGLLGRAICSRLAADGVPFRVLSRNPSRARSTVKGALSYHKWEPIEKGAPWVSVVEGAQAVVHLASPLITRSRWAPEYKQLLYDNCVVGTRGVVSAIAQAGSRPAVLVSASTAGFYPADDGKGPIDETQPAGGDYLGRLAADWESAAAHVKEFGVRHVSLRSGLVLARTGALRRLRWAALLGFGGPSSIGRGWQPWIHLEDEVGLVMLAIQDERARGPINCVAPEPSTTPQFMASVRAQVGVGGGIAAPPSLIPGAVIATAGRAVIPGRALALGYDFRHPQLDQALRALGGRHQAKGGMVGGVG